MVTHKKGIVDDGDDDDDNYDGDSNYKLSVFIFVGFLFEQKEHNLELPGLINKKPPEQSAGDFAR